MRCLILRAISSPKAKCVYTTHPVRRGAKLYPSFVIARDIQFGDERCIVSITKDRKNWVKAQPCSCTGVHLPAEILARLKLLVSTHFNGSRLFANKPNVYTTNSKATVFIRCLSFCLNLHDGGVDGKFPVGCQKKQNKAKRKGKTVKFPQKLKKLSINAILLKKNML